MIIFLDVDGVLNTVSSPHGVLDAQLKELQNALFNAFGNEPFGIVLTSSWRVDRVDDFLKLTTREDLGVSLRHNFIGITPYLCTQPGLDPGKRSLEIQAWRKMANYNSSRYIIIDDMPGWFTSADIQSPNFLEINGALGFNLSSSLMLSQKVKTLRGG